MGGDVFCERCVEEVFEMLEEELFVVVVGMGGGKGGGREDGG